MDIEKIDEKVKELHELLKTEAADEIYKVRIVFRHDKYEVKFKEGPIVFTPEQKEKILNLRGDMIF